MHEKNLSFNTERSSTTEIDQMTFFLFDAGGLICSSFTMVCVSTIKLKMSSGIDDLPVHNISKLDKIPVKHLDLITFSSSLVEALKPPR